MNRAEDTERVAQWQIPPQLAALPEHHSDLASKLAPLRDGIVAAGTHPPTGRDEDAGQHFDGGGFAGPVGPDVADCLAGHDRRADPVDRVHDSGFPTQPADLLPHCEGPTQILERDNRFFRHPQPPAPVKRRMPVRQASQASSHAQAAKNGANQPSQAGKNCGPGNPMINNAGR